VETQPWPTPIGAIGQPLPAFNPGSAAAPSEPVPDSFSFAKPMQWTPDRNAGFSGSDPARLYLPLIMDPIYGYQAPNVEAQERTCPGSRSRSSWTCAGSRASRRSSAWAGWSSPRSVSSPTR
jgi:hypothetical protein